MVDFVEPDETYSAARYAADAAAAIRGVSARGRLPILVGGTGLYYRALVRGMFPGPARDERLRAALERVAAARGVAHLHAMVARLDPASGARIQPRDRKRLVRALEVAYSTGVPLTAHFARTVSPIAEYDVVGLAIHLPAASIAERVARRVADQFARGVVGEVQRLLAAGVPSTAHAFSGLVYRQVIELLSGVRDEAATRALIAQENRHYARRQLIWFRKEPNLRWIDGPGESPQALERALDALAAHRAAGGQRVG
jgi:tRNA dimethylallyltransferase